jgi:tRNA-intron endonuclease
MEATLEGGVVRAGNAARERFYDSRGYGRPVDGGDLELAPVEAAHLLARDDLASVRDAASGDRLDFRAFLASATVSEVAYFAYADLRDRGFYLSPTAADGTATDSAVADFEVYPRGQGPWDDEVAFAVAAISERASVPATDLGDVVLAIVDEESAITYLETERTAIEGASDHDVPGVEGELLADRVLCWEPPAALHESAFYGQPRDGGAVQLSLVEAAYLASRGVLDVGGGAGRVRDLGREVEGERFDRRLTVYARLRDRGVVPKTGFKFGADFRTYSHVESVDDLGHSEYLVRVLPAEHVFEPRDLALDVRLAHGVRKEMRFGLVDGESIEWVAVRRLTP